MYTLHINIKTLAEYVVNSKKFCLVLNFAYYRDHLLSNITENSPYEWNKLYLFLVEKFPAFFLMTAFIILGILNVNFCNVSIDIWLHTNFLNVFAYHFLIPTTSHVSYDQYLHSIIFLWDWDLMIELASASFLFH